MKNRKVFRKYVQKQTVTGIYRFIFLPFIFLVNSFFLYSFILLKENKNHKDHSYSRKDILKEFLHIFLGPFQNLFNSWWVNLIFLYKPMRSLMKRSSLWWPPGDLAFLCSWSLSGFFWRLDLKCEEIEEILDIFPLALKQMNGLGSGLTSTHSCIHLSSLQEYRYEGEERCQGKVHRVTANHSLSSTASHGTSSIPVSLQLYNRFEKDSGFYGHL